MSLTPPPTGPHLVVSIPKEHVLLVRMNRPKELNAMTDEMEEDLRKTFDWFEENNSLWVAIITGTGRVFCAGQDLKKWLETSGTAKSPSVRLLANSYGFGSLSRRRSKKPIIAALNGHALGGGAEIVVNCDIIIGVTGGLIGFPEVKRGKSFASFSSESDEAHATHSRGMTPGVVAMPGGIPNLIRRSPAMAPYLLAGLPIPQRLLEQHVLTEVVQPDQVLPTAMRWAQQIVECSPEAVWVTKEQINLLVDGKGLKEIVETVASSPEADAMYGGENITEGLRSFKEKRNPVWRDPPRVFASKPKL